mmetsp:Transcript_64117/g.171533  ORF Transcript_64117/g.171533 Transcript_64117/m.171533 type:complete len:281 (+) Transcript_64117:348-1190(+)
MQPREVRARYLAVEHTEEEGRQRVGLRAQALALAQRLAGVAVPAPVPEEVPQPAQRMRGQHSAAAPPRQLAGLAEPPFGRARVVALRQPLGVVVEAQRALSGAIPALLLRRGSNSCGQQLLGTKYSLGHARARPTQVVRPAASVEVLTFHGLQAQLHAQREVSLPLRLHRRGGPRGVVERRPAAAGLRLSCPLARRTRSGPSGRPVLLPQGHRHGARDGAAAERPRGRRLPAFRSRAGAAQQGSKDSGEDPLPRGRKSCPAAASRRRRRPCQESAHRAVP